MPDTLTRLQSPLADRYLFVRELGRGGMATVYLAQDLKHERSVAVKVLLPELGASLGPERFLREIKLAASLQHPHILSVYDSGEANGLLYYVMPYVEGESLRDRLNREKQLGIDDAVQIALEVADALGYAHSRGIIHRDIKPENIMLTGGHALVADFGIARAVSVAGGEKLTQTGTAVGTPAYMSPEQATGDEDIDGRSDLYSLACVLYEMLAGAPPFLGPNPMAIMARHSMDAVPGLRIVRAAVPEELEEVIFQALEKVPADRFATAAQFAQGLLAPGTGTGARRYTGAARRHTTGTRHAARRRWLTRGRVVGLGTLALVAVGASAFLVWRSVRGGRAGDTSGPDPRRIAVLYFDDRSQDQKLGYLADGFTEALIHELSQVQALQVISRNGVDPYKGTRIASDSIARALKVGTLVHGSVAQSGNTLRVDVSLINTATGAEIGSKTLERPREDIFALQDDLAREVSVFLRTQLGQEILLAQSRAGTRNAAAWELVQRAQEMMKDLDSLVNSGENEAAGRQFARIDSTLARSEAEDRGWVTPIVLRGWLAYRQSRLSGTFDKSYYANWTEIGLGHAGRALQLKPGDPDALELRGTLRYWRWLLNLAPDPTESAALLSNAEQDLRASTLANPAQASAWNSLSHLLLAKSETADGKIAARRAYEADPYLTDANKTVWRLFASSLDLEDQVEANHWCEEGQRRFPQDSRFVECQLWLFALKGQKPDVRAAWQLLESYQRESPPNLREFRLHRGQMLVAMALARAGLAESARAVAVRARGDATLDPTRELSYLEAIVRTMLGDRVEALNQLSTFVATNPQQRVSLAKDQSWWFRELRSEPRFQSMFGGAR